MKITEIQNQINKLHELLSYAAADVEAAIEQAGIDGDPKGYFAALQRLDVATRASHQATQVIAGLWNIENGIKQSVSRPLNDRNP